MSKLQANLLTSGGIGAMLLIAQLPLIWNVGVVAATITGLTIINKKMGIPLGISEGRNKNGFKFR